MQLLRTELRRFFARRAIIGGLLAALLLALIVNAVQFARSTVIAGADRRMRVGVTFEATVRGVGIGLTLLVALLAATFIAADFGTSLSTQLLFEPRRRRVYVTKTVAAALGCAAIAVLVLVWCGALQYAGSALRGSTAGIDGAWLAHRAGDIGRAAGASAMMAVLAFALGAVTRKTAGAIGVLFGLLIGMNFLRHDGWPRAIGRIVPVNAIWAVAHGAPGDGDAFVGLHHVGQAVTIAAVWVIVITVLGAAWFTRHEIR